MKKKFLSIYVIMLISLLSCNTSDLNELTRKKTQDNKEKVLGFLEKIQADADNIKVVEKHIEKKGNHIKERKKQMVQAASVAPINVESNFPYYLQESIEIKEEELIPNTDEEKKAEKAIIYGGLEFAKLVDDKNKLKNESEQLESSFNNVYKEILELADLIQAEVHVAGRINNYYIRKTKTSKEKEYQKKEIQNKIEKQDLIKLFNRLLEKREDIEKLHTQLNSGISERASAKYFFEKAKETLKDAITERLKNERKNWSRTRKTHSNLAIQVKNDVENALDQLSASSSKIFEAMRIKEDIKQLLQEAKSFLDSSKRKICSSDDRFMIF
ncbi:P12 family lipoprotein (plasmid) [Borreliella lanei]|uniref:P12 family lipoprotein n=1 Tax=Borreliella lanei TaxID=373540 RepID=UPI003AF0938E